jgi:hypothetical protein
MPPFLPWIIATSVVVAGILALWLVIRSRRRKAPPPLPAEWNLVPRPVFSTDERRVYRQLREALPHHIVLSKLPLVRFCQPNDPQEVRYWYELLGAIHVTFAVCSANGRVLAAIDLDTDRGNSRRALQIKQAVLAACRVRYLRCPVDHMPSIPELQLLVPHTTSGTRGPQAAPNIHQARDSLSSTVATRRRERTALWQDSSVFQDSFFSPDSRGESSHPSGFGPLPQAGSLRRGPRTQAPEDIVGVVVDPPRYGGGPPR